MKKIVFIILILAFAINFAFAQAIAPKPLTQAEYVKMLYDLQKNLNNKPALIEVVRTRGIGFELTDGLRGLTRTKGANDAELLRTLEEANRRRLNPTTAQLPSEKESAEILTKAREEVLTAIEDMPDFVVKQQIQRSAAYAGTNNFRNLDRLIVAVSYRASGQEEYRILSVNGVLQTNPTANQTYEEIGGQFSTGEFVVILAGIFKLENETKFKIIDTDTIRTRRTVVFEYSIERDKLKRLVVSGRSFEKTTTTGMKGKIWIDRENFRVLRVETSATDIPETFPISSIIRFIDYDWVTINNEKYLLPLLSDVRMTSREGQQFYETRNITRFKDYQKYGSEVKVLDDEEEVQEEKPKQ